MQSDATPPQKMGIFGILSPARLPIPPRAHDKLPAAEITMAESKLTARSIGMAIDGVLLRIINAK